MIRIVCIASVVQSEVNELDKIEMFIQTVRGLLMGAHALLQLRTSARKDSLMARICSCDKPVRSKLVFENWGTVECCVVTPDVAWVGDIKFRRRHIINRTKREL